MIEASEAWKDIQQRFLTTEGHIEIKCAITENGAQELVIASGTNEAIFSNVGVVPNTEDELTLRKYATNELNLWALDGSRTILPNSAPYDNAGYVSDIAESGSITLTLPDVRTAPVPGVTITWSSEFEEYPPVFTVTAKNGDTVVAETTVTDNTNRVCAVDMDMVNYDSITITVHNWCLPYHRARIEEVIIGHILTLTKKDIINYTHEQYGDILGGQIPKNSIEFSLDNTDGRWNPNNPVGAERYLSERQKLTVRYGFDVNGKIEWVKAGTFYLSEWHTPSNGLEARFVARDVFEFLLNVDMSGSRYDSLKGLVETAIRYSLPDDASVVIHDSLAEHTGVEDGGNNTAAEIVQKCAHAARCVLRYDRDGVLHIEPLNTAFSGYKIPLSLSYSYPEVDLSKPLKDISVDYGGDTPYELSVASAGERQTVSNDFINTEEYAADVAAWVRDVLQLRKTVSGEFRADPRLDLFDIVTVETKYGVLGPVAITNIKYTFNGAFHGKYTGRVLESSALLGEFILGVSVLGEEV